MSQPSTPPIGQAFPSLREPYGLSVHDYFFAKCMQGILANPTTVPAKGETFNAMKVRLALAAHDIADEMMAVRGAGL